MIITGFVLAAGGLSLAELGVDAPGFSSTPNPAVADGDSAAPDGGTPASDPSPPAQPADTTHTDSSPTSPTSPTRSPDKASDTPTVTAPLSGQPQSATHPGTSDSTTPTDTTTTTPVSDPTTAEPSPDPSPSSTQKCSRFLWWCT